MLLTNSNVLDLLAPIGALSREGKKTEALNALSQLWATVPSPCFEMPNSHLIPAYGASISMKAGLLDEALTWAQRGLLYSGSVMLGGESEFLMGEVMFARGELNQASDYFRKTYLNSGRRYFLGKNPEFLRLAQRKEDPN